MYLRNKSTTLVPQDPESEDKKTVKRYKKLHMIALAPAICMAKLTLRIDCDAPTIIP